MVYKSSTSIPFLVKCIDVFLLVDEYIRVPQEQLIHVYESMYHNSWFLVSSYVLPSLSLSIPVGLYPLPSLLARSATNHALLANDIVQTKQLFHCRQVNPAQSSMILREESRWV